MYPWKGEIVLIATIPTICGSVASNPSGLGVTLHNAGYQELGLPYTYIALGTQSIDEALGIAKNLGFRGLAVSMPHKVAVIDRLDVAGDDVKAIGACNTVVFEEGTLIGHNTDWIGARNAIAEAGVGHPKTCVIIGAGGAARAIAYALKELGATVYVTARREDAARHLVNDLGLGGTLEMGQQGSVQAELVVNATPDSSATSPLQLDSHASASAVFDVAFSKLETPLVAEASRRGLVTVSGWRMLLHQALEQFRLYTQVEPPKEVMATVLKDALTASAKDS